MSSSNRHLRGSAGVKRLVAATLIIGMIGFTLPPSQAEVTGADARRVLDLAIDLLRKPSGPPKRQVSSQGAATPVERALQITHFRLCPRVLSLHVGEDYTLVPIALDRVGEIVHGVAYGWQTSNAAVAKVSGGTVDAVAAGLAVVSVSIGTALATVSVTVLPGARPRLTDQEWDIQHAADCTNPESVAATENDLQIAQANQSREQQVSFDNEEAASDFSNLAKPAVLHRGNQRTPADLKPVTASLARHTKNADPEPIAPQGGVGMIDGDGVDPTVTQETASFSNAIGSPRFSPQEVSMGSAAKTKNNLGSYNYSFAAPIVSLPGRGLGVNLAMIYNSRVWSKDSSTMTFNYNKGWPAAGWTLGYGRLIQDYAGAGSWLLLGPDGTRTPLSGALGQSTDGSFISFNSANGKVRYPDGTLVDFDLVNNRWLPTMIRNANGQKSRSPIARGITTSQILTIFRFVGPSIRSRILLDGT